MSSGKWLPFLLGLNVLNSQVMSAGSRASLHLGSRYHNTISICYCTKNIRTFEQFHIKQYANFDQDFGKFSL